MIASIIIKLIKKVAITIIVIKVIK